MATTKNIKQNALQEMQNAQAGTSPYINSMKQSAIDIQNQVLAQKYNDPQNQYLQAQYNKNQNDLFNIEQAQQQYGNLAQNLQDQQRQAALGLQQGQKYLPTQLNLQGLGSGGLSETSQVGLQNAYQNILARNRQQFGSDVNQLYKDLANTQRESNLALQQETSALDRTNKEILAQGIANAPDQATLDKYLKEYGKFIDPNLKIQADYKMQQFKELADQQKLSKDYGIADVSDYINIDALSPNMFNFKGSGERGKQDSLINLIKNKGNSLPNGTVINLNYGYGKANNYLIYNGKLYKTSKKATYKYEDLIDILANNEE